MQTFSSMRRSRFNYQSIIFLLLFGVALIYESIGTIYPFLSPLLGVGFYYWTQTHQNREKYFILFLFFCYTLYFEIDRDMILFSFVFTTFLYLLFIEKPLHDSLNCPFCLIVINVIYAYLGYYLINYFLAFIFNLPFVKFDISYFVYIITDILIVAAVL